jgi:hypothetical protein
MQRLPTKLTRRHWILFFDTPPTLPTIFPTELALDELHEENSTWSQPFLEFFAMIYPARKLCRPSLIHITLIHSGLHRNHNGDNLSHKGTCETHVSLFGLQTSLKMGPVNTTPRGIHSRASREKLNQQKKFKKVKILAIVRFWYFLCSFPGRWHCWKNLRSDIVCEWRISAQSRIHANYF